VALQRLRHKQKAEQQQQQQPLLVADGDGDDISIVSLASSEASCSGAASSSHDKLTLPPPLAELLGHPRESQTPQSMQTCSISTLHGIPSSSATSLITCRQEAAIVQEERFWHEQSAQEVLSLHAQNASMQSIGQM
jgi:hypothetical protein